MSASAYAPWRAPAAATQAANESQFWPRSLSDSACVTWLQRITMKVLNVRDPGNDLARACVTQAAFLSEGVPSQEWAQAYVFLLSIADLNKARDRISKSPTNGEAS